MLMNVTGTPPAHLFRGELGAELIVLSLSVVRIAQRLETESEIETGDGAVGGREGDFVVTSSTGERYPILPSVFYGTYQVLGRVGSRFVGRRLLHARHAWPIESPHAEFDYGPGRGKVAAPRGGWVYRSDEDDYGIINAEAKGSAHIVVGPASALEGTNWESQFQRAVWLISLLPPAMTMIALFAYSSALRGDHLLSQVLLGVEAICLVLAVAAVWWIRKARWVLKST